MWIVAPHWPRGVLPLHRPPRAAGEPAPALFDRPTDVVAIERALGMNDDTR